MQVLTALEPDAIRHGLGRDEFFWLDLTAPEVDELRDLADQIGLHPLALEDTLEWNQRPKVDVYGDHLLMVFYTARFQGDMSGDLVHPVEIHVYVSGGFVITVRREESLELDVLHDVLIPEGTEEEDYLVYKVLDGLVEGFIPVLDEVSEAIDELETEVLARTRRHQLQRIYRLKQGVQQLQRLAGPQQEAMEQAVEAIQSLPGLSRGSRPYLQDVADNLRRIGGELDRHHQDLTSLTDTFFNANQNRLNLLVTRLTVLATFFLVWTLVTSFFGQNFGWLVEHIDSRTEFLLYGVGGLLVPTLALAALAWWRREDWW